MAIINTRGVLTEKLQIWLHRGDFSSGDLNLMVQFMIQRLGVDLRIALNEQRVVIPDIDVNDGGEANGEYYIPGDYMESLSVEIEDTQGQLVNIPYMGIEEFGRVDPRGQLACGYHVSSDIPIDGVTSPVTANGTPTSTRLRTKQTSDLTLYIRPATGQDITLTYIGVPDLLEVSSGKNSKNPVMIELANVMFKALLLEAHIFLQDWEQYDRVLPDYQLLVSAANRRYENAMMAPGSAVSWPQRSFATASPVSTM